jgi:hypothetical protein
VLAEGVKNFEIQKNFSVFTIILLSVILTTGTLTAANFTGQSGVSAQKQRATRLA